MLRGVQSFVSGTPRLILRLDGFCLLASTLWAQHAGWGVRLKVGGQRRLGGCQQPPSSD